MEELDGTTKLPRAELLAELRKARSAAKVEKDKKQLYIFAIVLILFSIVTWIGASHTASESNAVDQNHQCIKTIQNSKNGIPFSTDAIEAQINICAKMFPVSNEDMQTYTQQQIQDETGQ